MSARGLSRRTYGALAAVALALGLLAWGWIQASDAGKHRPGSRGDRLERLRKHGREHRSQIVRDLAAMTAIASVSNQPDGVRQMADHLRDRFEAIGMTVENLADDGPPLLLVSGGAFQPQDDGGPEVTVLLYAHYDGQNVDPQRWDPTQPFTPQLYSGRADEGATVQSLDDDSMQPDWRLYGRAAADDKGPIAVVLALLEAITEHELGPTAVGVKILLDGEEESGDPHLGDSLASAPDRLAADVLISLDGPVFQTGESTVVFGVRGIASLDLTLYGATGDLHSGHYGNWAGNPAQELAWVLSTMADPFTGEAKVEGFYDCRQPLGELESQALAEIPDVDDDVQRQLGVVRRNTAYSLKQAVTYPSLNVRGLSSGGVGKQARTVVPATAEAAIDIRLVPDCDKATMAGLVRRHLESLGYTVLDHDPTPAERQAHDRIVKLAVRGGGYRGVRTPMDWPISRHVVNAVERATGQPPIRIPNMGGSLPFFHFEDRLGMRVLALPLVNHDNNQHGPNENVRVGNLWRGFDVLATLLLTYGELP